MIKKFLAKFENADFDALRNFIRIYLHIDDNDDLCLFDVDRYLWPLTKECFMGYYLKNAEVLHYDFLIENSEYKVHIP